MEARRPLEGGTPYQGNTNSSQPAAAAPYEIARMLLDQEIPIRCSQDTSHDSRPGIHTSALYEHMWHVLFKVAHILVELALPG